MELKYKWWGYRRVIVRDKRLNKRYSVDIINEETHEVSRVTVKEVERLIDKRQIRGALDMDVFLCHDDYETWGSCIQCVGTDYVSYKLHKTHPPIIPPKYTIHSLGHDSTYILNTDVEQVYIGTVIKNLFIELCKGTFNSLPKELQPIILDGDYIRLNHYDNISFSYAYVNEVSVFQITDKKLKSLMAKIKIAGGIV